MKYNKYPKYKNSGVSWLGEIPPLVLVCNEDALFPAILLYSNNLNKAFSDTIINSKTKNVIFRFSN